MPEVVYMTPDVTKNCDIDANKYAVGGALDE